MDNSTIFILGMLLFPLLLGPAIVLVLVLIGRAALHRKARGEAAHDLAASGVRRGCGLSLLLFVCAFCGLMVASAGGAIHPHLVTIAAPYVCNGAVETQSRNYSYKPGQQGIARNIFCRDPVGGRRDITLRTIGAAAIFYTMIFLDAALVLVAIVRLLKLRRDVDVELDIAAELGKRTADRLRIDADIVRRPAPPPDAVHQNLEERLRHLQSLRDGGLISEEEYRAKRAELLAGL